MTIHVAPHDQVEYEAAYVRAAESLIKARASAKRERAFAEANADAEAIITFIAKKAFTWATEYDWDRAHNDVTRLTPRTFFDKLHLSVLEYGAPTQGQADAVRKIMAQDAEKKAQWAARDASSQHVGNIGDRIVVEAICNFVTSFESNFGTTYISGYRDDAGNIYIHKGSAPSAIKGERYSIKATVKSHDERDGVKQTRIARPKWTKVEAA